MSNITEYDYSSLWNIIVRDDLSFRRIDPLAVDGIGNVSFDSYGFSNATQKAYEDYWINFGTTALMIVDPNVVPEVPEVPVAAVPVPATWGMMILGFGVIGASMRRRKSAVRTTVSLA